MRNRITAIDCPAVRGKPPFLENSREKVIIANRAGDIRLSLRPHTWGQRSWVIAQSNIWSNTRIEHHRLGYLFLRGRSAFCRGRNAGRQYKIAIAIKQHQRTGRQPLQRKITKVRRKFAAIHRRSVLPLLAQGDGCD